MQRIPVTSTMLASVGYDATTRTLEAEFAGGGVYRYSDVPPEVHEDLMAAESHGRYFNAHIRGCYPYDRVA